MKVPIAYKIYKHSFKETFVLLATPHGMWDLSSTKARIGITESKPLDGQGSP